MIYVYILNHLAYRIFEIQLILFDWEEKWERKRERNTSCVNGNPLGPYISFKTQERAGDTPHTVLYNIAKRKQRGSNVFVIFWQTTTPFSPFIILQGWNWSMTLKLHVEIFKFVYLILTNSHKIPFYLFFLVLNVVWSF